MTEVRLVLPQVSGELEIGAHSPHFTSHVRAKNPDQTGKKSTKVK